jgi:cytochrome P450
VKDEWVVDYIEDRRREPRDDVLTRLAQATFPDGTTPEPLAVARVASFLFAAGQQTTVDHLATSLVMLAEHPDLQEQLREDYTLIPAFVEEMLHLESPTKANFRLTRRPVTVGDVALPAGCNVLIMLGSANRDPRRFELPNELRLDRTNALEHVAFGRGTHACPGAPLARAESRVSLERILDRMGGIHLSEEHHGPPGERRFDWEPTFLLRRVKAVHVKFTPIG